MTSTLPPGTASLKVAALELLKKEEQSQWDVRHFVITPDERAADYAAFREAMKSPAMRLAYYAVEEAILWKRIPRPYPEMRYGQPRFDRKAEVAR